MTIGPKTQRGRSVFAFSVLLSLCLVALFFLNGVESVLVFMAVIGVVALFILSLYLVIGWILNGE